MNTKFQIIGLSGTNGAGKDAVGEIMAKTFGYYFISVTELLRDECRRRGLPVERQYLSQISAEWRREHGLAVLVDRAIETFKALEGDYRGLVMSSLRNPYEADRIHEVGGSLVWVDADPYLRYERIQRNAAVRARGGEDDKTFEQFQAEETAEMQQSGDEATLNMSAVKARADITLLNESDDLSTLTDEIRSTFNLA